MHTPTVGVCPREEEKEKWNHVEIVFGAEVGFADERPTDGGLSAPKPLHPPMSRPTRLIGCPCFRTRASAIP